jgi:hypothetical protein
LPRAYEEALAILLTLNIQDESEKMLFIKNYTAKHEDACSDQHSHEQIGEPIHHDDYVSIEDIIEESEKYLTLEDSGTYESFINKNDTHPRQRRYFI